MKIKLAGDWVKRDSENVLIHNDLMDRMIGADLEGYAYRLLIGIVLGAWQGEGVQWLKPQSLAEKKTIEKLVSLGFLEIVE